MVEPLPIRYEALSSIPSTGDFKNKPNAASGSRGLSLQGSSAIRGSGLCFGSVHRTIVNDAKELNGHPEVCT